MVGQVSAIIALGLLPAFGAIVTFIAYRRSGAEGRAMRRLVNSMLQRADSAKSAPTPDVDDAVDARDDQVGIEALGDPALLVGAKMRVIAANRPAQNLFGDRLAGEDLRLVLRHPAVLDAVREAIAAGGPVGGEVSGLGGPDGAYRIRAVGAGGGRLLLTFSDITQTRLTERMRVDFVANASHELRTPLATLAGFIETLQGPAADDEPARRRFLEIMSREAARMSRLIDDLLSLSRIELDKYVRPQAALDLPPVIADVGKTLAMRLEADERPLQIELAPELPSVIADRDQILQVLHNLVSNALKYGRSGTPIIVAVEVQPAVGARTEPMVCISVRDQGEGIAPEHLPRLTERFYRVDTSRSRSMGGTGLGLAIAKHIVERHRGTLDISSAPGEGTRIAFTLPIMGKLAG
jgi:two-component system, OmpR family, phosphate regulon sensor histidine kinase PhoR